LGHRLEGKSENEKRKISYSQGQTAISSEMPE